jgi:hypothetical protein
MKTRNIGNLSQNLMLLTTHSFFPQCGQWNVSIGSIQERSTNGRLASMSMAGNRSKTYNTGKHTVP